MCALLSRGFRLPALGAITLRPGDIIATGTPAVVGNARDPKAFLFPGNTVVTEISGLGTCTNKVVEA